MSDFFSLSRLAAIIGKEFIQMRRDRMTFAMMVGIPILQLVVFGFAINTDPKNLPTAVLTSDYGPFTRALLASFQQSGYFNIIREAGSEKEAEELLKQGQVTFVISVPPDFSGKLVRGERPAILIEADATDPIAVGNALVAAETIAGQDFNRNLSGATAKLKMTSPPLELVIHRNFNPEGVTQYNTIPGLLGVILTLTMVFITSLAITREMERGTMENLLSLPVRPLEVMIGKITPYILVGFVQVILILAGARYIFHIPMLGSIVLLLCITLFFIAANLAVGVTFSTVARNQLQAVQMSIFFFLPSIMLSGFMFPFHGMPYWARVIGSILPLTHFNLIVRGILLKGNEFREISHHFWCILAFLVCVLVAGAVRYRKTLD